MLCLACVGVHLIMFSGDRGQACSVVSHGSENILLYVQVTALNSTLFAASVMHFIKENSISSCSRLQNINNPQHVINIHIKLSQQSDTFRLFPCETRGKIPC